MLYSLSANQLQQDFPYFPQIGPLPDGGGFVDLYVVSFFLVFSFFICYFGRAYLVG